MPRRSLEPIQPLDSLEVSLPIIREGWGAIRAECALLYDRGHELADIMVWLVDPTYLHDWMTTAKWRKFMHFVDREFREITPTCHIAMAYRRAVARHGYAFPVYGVEVTERLRRMPASSLPILVLRASGVHLVSIPLTTLDAARIVSVTPIPGRPGAHVFETEPDEPTETSPTAALDV